MTAGGGCSVIFSSGGAVCGDHNVSGDHTVCLAVFVDGRCRMLSKQGSHLCQQLLGKTPRDGQCIRKELFAGFSQITDEAPPQSVYLSHVA